MADEKKMKKLDKIDEYLREARKLAAEISDMPTISYRGADMGSVKLDARLESILRYIGNGCPNVYYADDWRQWLTNPRDYTVTARIDEMIGAVEMAKIQESIGDIAPELVGRMG